LDGDEMGIIFPKGTKRKAGMRAGLSKATIIAAGTKLLVSAGPDNFSIRLLAKKLKVGPTTIHHHFKGGKGALTAEIARAALAELAPPHDTQVDPKEVLRKLFRRALDSYKQRPVLGRFVVINLTDDPFFNPVFAKRLVTAIAALSKNDNLAWGLDLVIGRFGSLIFSETSEAARAKPDEARVGILKKISVLPPAEFPMLAHTAEALAADPLKRADPEYFGTLVDGVVDAIVHDLADCKP
jgi:AcrR family transcriptional regulator